MQKVEYPVVEEGFDLVCPKGCQFLHRYKIFRIERGFMIGYYCPKEPHNIGGKEAASIEAFNSLIRNRLATAV